MDVVGYLFLLIGLVSLWLNGRPDRYAWWGITLLALLPGGVIRAANIPWGPALLLALGILGAAAWAIGAGGFALRGPRVAALIGAAVVVGGSCWLAGLVPPGWLIALVWVLGDSAGVVTGLRAGVRGLMLGAFVLAVGADAVDVVAALWPTLLTPATLASVQVVAHLTLAVALLRFELAARREIVEQLQRSEEHFRMIFEHSGVAMALLTPQGGFVRVNPAMVQLFGYQVEELQGRTLIALAGDDSLKASRTEQGLDLPEGVYERERTFLRKDGQPVVARVVRVPLRDTAGLVRYLVAVVIDVTERKRAEEAVRLSDEKLRQERDFWTQVVGTSAALILVLDRQGRLVRCNDAARELVRPNAAPPTEGTPLETLFPGPLATTLRGHIERLLRVPGMEAFEATLPGTEGERWIAWRVSPTRDPRQPGLVVLTGVDVTDERRLEEQLRQSQKMECLGTLVGGIAHDFNNQLAIVLGNLELLLHESRRTGTRRELLDAERAARRCADMTQSLLTFSRRRVVQLRQVNLAAFLGELGPLLQRVLPATIQVEIDAPQATWHIQADSTQLHQVLMNLAINARDAMPDGGRLRIALANRTLRPGDTLPTPLARPGHFVVLSVGDTGTGMTPEVKERVFEPFFTTKEVGKGTGLGLPVVFGIVQAHQGWILLASEPGQGTMFEIWLPGVTPAPEIVGETFDVPAVRGGAESILLVDDEEMLRGLGRSVLERWGYRVLTAANGEEALAAVQQYGRDIGLVVLDLTMPGMTGLQLLPLLRRLIAGLPIIFSSGYGDADALIAAGANAFLAKPYRPDELVRLVRRVLDAPK